jgi:predicted nucleic acid-binding protein
MIVVDTSVWVSTLRRSHTDDAVTLRQLIDADEIALALPVRFELMAGVARRDRAALARGLSALPLLRPTEETWRLIEGWIAPAADRGDRFAITDLLIAGLASEIGGLVWSLDDDFARMAAAGFVQTYR